jgi:hypothetical protein
VVVSIIVKGWTAVYRPFASLESMHLFTLMIDWRDGRTELCKADVGLLRVRRSPRGRDRGQWPFWVIFSAPSEAVEKPG